MSHERKRERERERDHEADTGVVQNQDCVSKVEKSEYAFEESHGWRNSLLPSVNNCSKSGTKTKAKVLQNWIMDVIKTGRPLHTS